MRPKKAADELSFYFFVLSQLSVEMRRRSSLRKVLTPRLCLSLVTIRTICVLILTESLLWHDSGEMMVLTLLTPILQYSSIHWSDTSCATGRHSHIRPSTALRPPVTGLWWAVMSLTGFMHLLWFLCQQETIFTSEFTLYNTSDMRKEEIKCMMEY